MDQASEDHWRELSEQISTGMRRVEAEPSQSHMREKLKMKSIAE